MPRVPRPGRLANSAAAVNWSKFHVTPFSAGAEMTALDHGVEVDELAVVVHDHRRDPDRHALEPALGAEREHRVARVEVTEVDAAVEQQRVDRLQHLLLLQPGEVAVAGEEDVGHLAGLTHGAHERLAGGVGLDVHLRVVVQRVVDRDQRLVGVDLLGRAEDAEGEGAVDRDVAGPVRWRHRPLVGLAPGDQAGGEQHAQDEQSPWSHMTATRFPPALSDPCVSTPAQPTDARRARIGPPSSLRSDMTRTPLPRALPRAAVDATF